MLGLAACFPDALIGLFQAFVAASAWAWTIGHSRRGRRWLCMVCFMIESSTAPYTSFWRWL
jgi:hypothetical protein